MYQPETLPEKENEALSTKSQKPKSSYIRDAFMMVIGALLGGIMTFLVQGQLYEKQAAIDAEAVGIEKQKELVVAFSGLHEDWLMVDTKGVLASEAISMKQAFEGLQNKEGLAPEAEIAKRFQEMMQALGLDTPNDSFSRSAEEYSQTKKELVKCLTEIDLYFSDVVTQKARRYRKHMAWANDGDGYSQSGIWLEGIKKIFERPGFTNWHIDMMAAIHQQVMDAAKADQTATVTLYNDLYYAMRDEVSQFK